MPLEFIFPGVGPSNFFFFISSIALQNPYSKKINLNCSKHQNPKSDISRRIFMDAAMCISELKEGDHERVKDGATTES